MRLYVSVTSIKQNQTRLLSTLKSIKTQTIKPNKCFIYLSEEPYLLDKGFKDRILNKNLENFINKNNLFEIRWCRNTGPYRKLLPLLKEKFQEDCLILTIDDDVIYHRWLIKYYLRDYASHNCCINYRGYTMVFDKSIKEFNYKNRFDYKLVPYNLYNFHTGKAGVLYHPSFFYKTGNLIFNEELYMKCCPTGDDIWFNLCRIANGVNCFVKPRIYSLKDITNEKCCLFYKYNRKNDLNTQNIRQTVDVLTKLGYSVDRPIKVQHPIKPKKMSTSGVRTIGPINKPINSIRSTISGDKSIAAQIIIHVGRSPTNIKVIPIDPDLPKDINLVLKKHLFPDRFTWKIQSDKLTIQRLDKNEGWGHEHVLHSPSQRRIANIIAPRSKLDYSQNIPPILFQTFKDNYIHTTIYKNIQKFLQLNPEYEYRFISNKSGLQLLRDNFTGKVAKAYLKLNLGAAKGDFLRYCALYLYGGVYLDLDASITTKLRNFILPSDEHVLFFDQDKNLEQFLFMVKPKHIFLKTMINEMVERINNNERNIFLATGPTLFTDVIYNILNGSNVYNTKQVLSNRVRQNCFISNKDAMNGRILDRMHKKQRKLFSFRMKNYREKFLYNGEDKYIVTFNSPTPNFYKSIIEKSVLPKVIFQTGIKRQTPSIIKVIKSKCPDWTYKHFMDEECLQFFRDNPLEEFPNIISVFNGFSRGAHKADLFRYYYLYLYGGVFLDSDAIIEQNIEDILQKYEFISITSYHTDKKMMFNGFIASYPRNTIMYKALKKAYKTNDKLLTKDYHLLCKQLFKIVKVSKQKNMMLYRERRTQDFPMGVRTYNRNNKLVLTHYCYTDNYEPLILGA